MNERPADREADLLGPRWLWTVRGSSGVQIDLWWDLGLRVLAETVWIQRPVTVARTGLESGWGISAGLTWTLPMARIQHALPKVFRP